MTHNADGDFTNWVMSHKARVITISSSPILSILAFLFNKYPAIIDSLKNKWGLALWYGIHVILILVLFGYTCVVTPLISDKYPKPSKAVKDFYYLFLSLWIVWMMLYVSLTIRAVDPFNIRQDLINNAKTVSNSLRFVKGDTQDQEFQNLLGEDTKKAKENLEALRNAIILADKYEGKESGNNNESLTTSLDSFKSSQTEKLLKVSDGIVNFFNNLQSLVVLLLFWVLAYPRDTKKFFQILMAFLVGILIYFVIELFLNFSGIVVGIFGAIAMALWVGRLDSKYLMTPFLGIISLYFYAVLQVMWFVHHFDDEKILIITGFAMFLKVVVYLICSWLVESGKLLYFFEEMRLLYGLSKETEANPMFGKATVKERSQAFLDDLSKTEVSN